SQAMFLRVDMPGHIRHKGGDTFSEVYLSYHGRIPSSNFLTDFAPDEKYHYLRQDGKIPKRFIRAYRLRDPRTGKQGPWLAGMTLDPSAVYEAWCHQRGYVCMIEEFGGRPVRPGGSFSAAFLVGYFDSIPEMERVYDEHAGHSGLEADEKGWRLTGKQPEWLAARLEWFRDQKFGFFMHWGAYSQMGVIESWPLVWADRKWSNPKIRTREEMADFRRKYFALPRTFNPVEFDPAPWAKLARRAGMKYVVFTTKHHDGFAMFDTRLSDYRITAPEVPFSRNPRADVTAAIFNAFRAEGFGIGAYFSKSDWHSPHYWKPEVFAEDRNPNYDTAAEPERWARFVDFVHGQTGELMSRYGRIDILWLDGGQVRPPKQDIRMDRLVEMARRHQPGLIVVDRTAGTRHENYRTPEQEVPDQPILDYAWESCITMGRQWSYKPDDEYKPARELIHLLAGVVAKGGNLLLNVGPRPDGRLPAEAVSRLEEIGGWMAVNAEAIHGTRPAAPYSEDRVAFTRKGRTVYAIYLAEEGTERPPARIALRGFQPAAGARVRLLGSNAKVAWTPEGSGVVIQTPAETAAPCRYAFVFKFEQALR
ncbi:MAG: alpha-L-fucosidase, partial [Bryobacterales bacterium]|nr:alpha-L-fucosidase [Bryobacterales bacterium]